MEIIYKKDDVVKFAGLEIGDIFEADGLFIKIRSNDELDGMAINLRNGVHYSFYPDTKVTRKDVVLTVM